MMEANAWCEPHEHALNRIRTELRPGAAANVEAVYRCLVGFAAKAQGPTFDSSHTDIAIRLGCSKGTAGTGVRELVRLDLVTVKTTPLRASRFTLLCYRRRSRIAGEPLMSRKNRSTLPFAAF
jgi:hypothetical protein